MKIFAVCCSRTRTTQARFAKPQRDLRNKTVSLKKTWMKRDGRAARKAAGTKAVIVCPIGFVADHIEVVWDLDEELRAQAEALGIAFARAATPNADRRFARLAAGLIGELRDDRLPARVTGADPVPGCLASVDGQPCRPPHCAAPER